jgi:glycogen debranching enzyme
MNTHELTFVIPTSTCSWRTKILHETRLGELAALREIPFGRYYGSVDSTPLFVMLAGAYWERTGDVGFIRALCPAVDAALDWIDRYGDADGDGFVEYLRQSSAGLLHQGWKDADDAIMHEDGTIAEGPVALCEVQGYVYAARRAAAALAAALGLAARADPLMQQAAALKAAFDRAFWCAELDTLALALDGRKRPCRVRSSNAGQCLFSGIVACAPQAWASGSVFLLLQACLGLSIDGVASRMRFDAPSLPAGLTELRIQGLPIGEGRVDVSAVRRGSRIDVNVLRRIQAADVDVCVE